MGDRTAVDLARELAYVRDCFRTPEGEDSTSRRPRSTRLSMS
nr:hypothetical protein JVH1_4138 [Rhodococcus sp. JVH1]